MLVLKEAKSILFLGPSLPLDLFCYRPSPPELIQEPSYNRVDWCNEHFMIKDQNYIPQQQWHSWCLKSCSWPVLKQWPDVMISQDTGRPRWPGLLTTKPPACVPFPSVTLTMLLRWISGYRPCPSLGATLRPKLPAFSTAYLWLAFWDDDWA